MKLAVAVVGAALLAAASNTGANPEDEGWRAFTEVAAVLTIRAASIAMCPAIASARGRGPAPRHERAPGRGRARDAGCPMHELPQDGELARAALSSRSARLAAATPCGADGLARADDRGDLPQPEGPGAQRRRGLSQLVEHVSKDQIVNWGWDPGPGRGRPPLSHGEFVRRFVQWAESGAPCGLFQERR